MNDDVVNISSCDDDVILNEKMSLIVNIDEDKIADGEEYQSINSTNINIINTWLVNMFLMKQYNIYIYYT